MRRHEERQQFDEYVGPRLERWRHSAYLMCRDWHLADDITSDAVLRLYRNWSKVMGADNPDAYAQKILTRCWLTERSRRWWSREETRAAPPESAWTQDDQLGERQTLDRLLSTLGPRQRAVLILRFYQDYSVEETADILGIAAGTVKSQCSRALESLRTAQPTSGM